MQEKKKDYWPHVAVRVDSLEDHYFKYLRQRYRAHIASLKIESRRYYVSYAEKLDSFLCDDCLLLAYYDEETGKCGL
jgi:hypothetical protein